MQTIILYHHKDYLNKLQLLKNGLLFENIRTELYYWNKSQELDLPDLDFDIIIIHTDSPDNTILRTIVELQIKKYKNPIIVIDETESEETRKEAFELGACGYFTEELSPAAFAMELKKVIYKKAALHGKYLRAYDLRLDLETRFVRRNDLEIKLRNKEFSLLEFIVINRGKIVTRNSILEHVWDRNASFASNTVDVHINRLRRKIDDPFREKLIHTVHCLGYVFDRKKKE